MTVKIFNGFTCNARVPASLKTGLVCTLVETDQGLVLIDTGPGLEDYARPSAMMTLFRIVTIVPFDSGETAYHQIQKLGCKPEDVRHIILTHMHFDHCGGLPDFPWATVHVHQWEYEAFNERTYRWTDAAYVHRHAARVKDWKFYTTGQDKWYDFDAIRLPFEPEMWLIPLHGHSRGLCGVAVKMDHGWFFNASDAGAIYNDTTPAWLIKLMLGPHDQRLRQFMHMHPEVKVVNAHMFPEFFTASLP